jgi:hypothetical protein
MIYIFSSKNAAAIKQALTPAAKTPWAEVSAGFPPAKNSQAFEFTTEDIIYLDPFRLEPAELKKSIAQFKKLNVRWGIIDPKGAAEDPASFFFEGASDYIGSALVKSGLTKKRFSAAILFASGKEGKAAAKDTGRQAEPESARKTQKLPSGKFEGWKMIKTGAVDSFFFLFVSFSKDLDLRALAGEAVFKNVKNILRDVLRSVYNDANSLLWMESENNFLFLFPYRAANCKAVIEASLKFLLNSRLIGIEKLGLSIPVEFTVALHSGKTTFQAPGKTGSVFSEAVNFIFHLGTKKAASGRLTISGDVNEEVISDGIADLFSSAGIFEGITVRHSKRFTYK